jgi:hypothetical protein
MSPIFRVCLAALLFAPAHAFALGEELFGNAPRVKQPEWAEGVLDVVNLKSRVYLQWVNGNESFFYQGDAAALAEALKAFAAVKDEGKSVVLLPGTGSTKSFQGKPVAFDWRLHVPSGIYRAMTKETHPELTIYVPAAKPGLLADRPAAERAVADLDAAVFADREAAEAALRKLGRSAKPVLTTALAGKPTAEQKRRLDKLLKDLPGIDLGDLALPKDLTVYGPDDLVERRTKGLSDPDTTRRALNVNALAALAPFDPDVVPKLVKLLDATNHEYVRRMAAYALGAAGGLAKSALPALKAGTDDPDKNVADAFKTAVEQIENAKELPAETVATTKAVLGDIREWKKGREKK